MFNYNVINPVNIHYRKYPQNNENGKISDEENSKKQTPLTTDENGGGQRRFPNGNKVAIDYTKNQINIAQVLQDFRSTIAAINSPDDVKEEVESYLGLVGKESLKDEPSREIVLSNLKNAARVTDKYIQDSLKKPSRVVQDWVDALFLQKVNLKSDPNEINEEFRVKIPPKKTAQTSAQATYEPYSEAYTPPSAANHGTNSLAPLDEDVVQLNTSAKIAQKPSGDEAYEIDGSYIETSYEQQMPEVFVEPEAVYYEPALMEEAKNIEAPEIQAEAENDPYAAITENEALAKEILLQGKAAFNQGADIYTTLKLYDEALELLDSTSSPNIKSAIYFERAKIFDSYDYAELALIDYNKATKCEDGNLKTQAHIKMGNIYDDYVQFEPAMDQYSRAIETSEEVNNLQGKTRALRYIASMFTRLYDTENTETFSELAIESAIESKNPKTIAKTYLETAENYKYIGDDSKALQVYARLAQENEVQDDFETLAQNYMEASALMDKKGNKKKSYALMLKSKEYQRMARLRRAEA